MTVERLSDLGYIKLQIDRIDNEIMRLAVNAGPIGLRSPNMSGMPRKVLFYFEKREQETSILERVDKNENS